jgi:putative ABC transport system permease protein
MRPPLHSAALLALRLLAHDRLRLLTSTAGITFALLLMLAQLGFRNALLDSSLELLRQLRADALVINKEKLPFLARDDMPWERVYQALSVEGVEAAYPLWLDKLFWTNLEDGTERPIRVIGFQPGDPVFRNPDIDAAAQALRTPWTALIDSRSRPSYGRLGPGPAEVNRHRLEVVGTFPLGSDFESDGNLIVGDQTFAMLTGHDARRLELAALHLAPGADPRAVTAALRARLPSDVQVFTKSELLERDLLYWKRGTPLSILLLIGMALGFAVGVVTCYQILYTDVLDHMAQFATVKALGYGDAWLHGVVLVEAWVLALLAFGPGLLLGGMLHLALGAVTRLPVHFSWSGVGLVLALSLGMCTAAGFLALRRLARADPAELF